jgi:xanthine dehydrogenase accessory factor
VSGGCVESSVIIEALTCIETGTPKLHSYGITDENPWTVGLACGGKIQVFVEPLFDRRIHSGFTKSFFKKLKELSVNEQACSIITLLTGETAGEKILWCNNEISSGKPYKYILLQKNKKVEIFIEPFLPQPRMIIVGAVQIATALVNFAHEIGYKTIVTDPRSAFLTPERFPTADLIIHAWPDNALENIHLNPHDCFVVLSHDEKIDVPALLFALETTCSYIGLLGSRKTRDGIFSLLRQAGISVSRIARIHSPIGLDIGAIRPEEIALAIIAEIIASQNKKQSRTHSINRINHTCISKNT